MARILVTALSAFSVLMFGIVSLQYSDQSIAAEGLSGTNATAFNLTREVATDGTTILGNALPLLFIVVLLALMVVLLVMNR